MAHDGLVMLLQASRRTARLPSPLTRWGLPAWAQILRSPAWTPKESAGRCDPHTYSEEGQENAWLALLWIQIMSITDAATSMLCTMLA